MVHNSPDFIKAFIKNIGIEDNRETNSMINGLLSEVLEKHPQFNEKTKYEKAKDCFVDVFRFRPPDFGRLIGYEFDGLEKGFWNYIKRIWFSIINDFDKIKNTFKHSEVFVTDTREIIELEPYGYCFQKVENHKMVTYSYYLNIGYDNVTDTLFYMVDVHKKVNYENKLY